jgi:serine/threonine protein kinase
MPRRAPSDQSTGPAAEPPECLYEARWRAAGPLDLAAYLAKANKLSAADAAAVICADQRLRWAAGARPTAQSYLDAHSTLLKSPAAALDVVFNEYLLREQFGPSPSLDEFARRYPTLADDLGAQLAFHAAIGGAVTGSAVDGTWNAGRLVGRYRIVRPLGRGGMGVVFLAEDQELHREVALKVPTTAALSDPVGEARFLREARVAAGLRHPHLCPIYDMGRAAGRVYFTMPYLSGESLRDRLARGPVDPRTAARWAAKVARAVAIMHRAGLVHRDLKPANVMVDEEDEPVVMDFGLSRSAAPNDGHVTASGAIVGTPAYMSPECVAGQPPGPAGDVYSLGVMLYEMLTGRLPFAGSAADMMAARLVDEPPRPSRMRRGLDPRFDAICARATARRTNDRYPTMDHFANDLEAAVARNTSRRRHRPWLWLAIGTLALVAVATVTVIHFGGKTGRSDGGEQSPSTAGNGTAPSADSFAVGSIWRGDFQFQQFPRKGDVELQILERSGNTFRARYITEAAANEWLASGTTNGDQVEWVFTKAIRGDAGGDATLVGRAHVIGRVSGDRFTGKFEYLNGGSPADVTLTIRRRKS